jgi:hypothetical protein
VCSQPSALSSSKTPIDEVSVIWCDGHSLSFEPRSGS